MDSSERDAASGVWSHFFDSSSSIALMTFGSSGLIGGANRATTSPLRPTMNFSKFQVMSPANFGFVSFDVRNWYSGVMPSPFTTTFDSIGNLTPYLVVQNVEISASVPGSWWLNSLAG